MPPGPNAPVVASRTFASEVTPICRAAHLLAESSGRYRLRLGTWQAESSVARTTVGVAPRQSLG